MSSSIRIVFMGTPDFAVPILRTLHIQSATQEWQVVAVVTQPDRPAGRGKKLTVSPVKAYAQEAALPILQPHSYKREPEAVAALAALAPDLIVVAAFGQILPPAVLEIPTFGCVNVHASLLPAYRGASPIQAAILNGDEATGVTLMLMDAGMDTGPALALASLPLRPDDTAASLGERLAAQGAELLAQALPRWLAGEIAPIPQAELPGEVSICRMIRKEAGRINWHMPAVQIERMVRAYAPWPGAFTTWQGEIFKLLQAEAAPAGQVQGRPGQVVATPQGPGVVTGEGQLILHRVQPAAKRPLAALDFLNGAPNFVGGRLGGEETGEGRRG